MEAKTYSLYLPADRSLRASDTDREAVGDILRRAHVQGRLDADEFAERFGRSLEAKTYAELDALLLDLPIEQAEPPAASSGWWANPAPAWPSSGWLPPGGGPAGGGPGYPGGPFGPPAQQRSHWLWPGAALVLFWLAITLVVFSATGGHLIWFFFPLAWVFWFTRGGRYRRRRSEKPQYR